MDESHLKSLPLFSGLSKRELRQVASHADEVDVPEGHELVKQGDWAWEFFAIEQGRAEVMRDGEHLADLGPGDFLGEMGLLEHAPRNASVIARSPMTVIVMTGQDFRRIDREMPEIASRIQSAVEERATALVA
jgi:CRP/FNR family cyclic AMP-dependent transcriptional regulator